MSNLNKLVVVLLCSFVTTSVGCRSKEPVAPKASTAAPKTNDGPVLAPPQQPPTEGDPNAKASSADTAKPAGEDSAEAAKIKASFAKLSTEDRALAEKQKICPVSNEKLGTMGAPKKIKVAGHEVFICCEGCEDALTSDPAKFLPRIGLKPEAEK